MRFVKRQVLFWSVLALFGFAWLAACKALAISPLVTHSAASLTTTEPSPLAVLSTVAAVSPTQAPVTPTSPPRLRICSPLPGYEWTDLMAMISNPYHPPPPGSDNPHEGIDLAVQQNGIALVGYPVQAVFPGLVAAVIDDRFPYGNALFVETPLDSIPQGWLAQLQLPALVPTLGPYPVLTCPKATPAPTWDFNKRSLYLVYAHLEEKVVFKIGDPVECGMPVGKIGQSGNALNPHLHLEARVGPSGVRFQSMAHYDNSATPLEMSNYCIWRVSGAFQLVDPIKFLSLLP